MLGIPGNALLLTDQWVSKKDFYFSSWHWLSKQYFVRSYVKLKVKDFVNEIDRLVMCHVCCMEFILNWWCSMYDKTATKKVYVELFENCNIITIFVKFNTFSIWSQVQMHFVRSPLGNLTLGKWAFIFKNKPIFVNIQSERSSFKLHFLFDFPTLL